MSFFTPTHSHHHHSGPVTKSKLLLLCIVILQGVKLLLLLATVYWTKMGFCHPRTSFLLFLLTLVVLVTIGTADYVEFQLDTVADKRELWKFVDHWFVYGHNMSMFQQYVAKKHYPIPDGFKDQFKTKALGMWGLFRDMKEIPRPSTSLSFETISTGIGHVNITYFMYGQGYINVTYNGNKNDLIATPINSDCFSKGCINGFKTETLILKNCTRKNTDCSGSDVVPTTYYGFTISLKAANKDSFILIDKITPVPTKWPVEGMKMSAIPLGTKIIKANLMSVQEDTNDDDGDNDKSNENFICLSFVWLLLVVFMGIFAVVVSTIMVCKMISFERIKKLLKKLRHILFGAPDGSDEFETVPQDDGEADTKLIRDFPNRDI